MVMLKHPALQVIQNKGWIAEFTDFHGADTLSTVISSYCVTLWFVGLACFHKLESQGFVSTWNGVGRQRAVC